MPVPIYIVVLGTKGVEALRQQVVKALGCLMDLATLLQWTLSSWPGAHLK